MIMHGSDDTWLTTDEQATWRAFLLTSNCYVGLARALRHSQSRSTHAVKTMEGRGWARRERCSTDRRGQLAVLTKEGRKAIKAAASSQLAVVRLRVFDQLSDDQVIELRSIYDRRLEGERRKNNNRRKAIG